MLSIITIHLSRCSFDDFESIQSNKREEKKIRYTNQNIDCLHRVVVYFLRFHYLVHCYH